MRGLVAAVRLAGSPDNVLKHVVRQEQAAVKLELQRRSRGKCEGCHVRLPDEDMLHIHHVVSVSTGGTNAGDNVALLCPNCHAIAHWFERSGRNATCRDMLLDRLRVYHAMQFVADQSSEEAG